MWLLLSDRVPIILCLLSVSLTVLPWAYPASNEPDLRKEKRLHQNYQLYNAKPTSAEAWKGVLSGKTETYAIQANDTLWDLSQVLFGDPEYWPKVWSLNSGKIENPHQIYPGQSLHFTAGTVEEPPSLAVAKAGEEKPEAAKLSSIANEKSAVDNRPPEADPKNQDLLSLANIPPETPPRNVATLPGSIPHWAFGAKVPVLQIDTKRIVRTFPPGHEPLGFYLTASPLSSVGTVVEGEMGEGTLGEYQYLHVKLPEGNKEKKLLAYQEREEIQDPISGKEARIIQVQGEIEVLDIVNSEENIYRAFVKKIINPLNVGANLAIGKLPQFQAKTTQMGSASAQVIGGQNDKERRLIESASIVYLAGDGLAEGQSYPIYRQQSIRQEETRAIENPRKIGEVKVVKVSDRFATAVVIDESEEIHVGDVTDPHMKKDR
jgi:hypothetical protein